MYTYIHINIPYPTGFFPSFPLHRATQKGSVKGAFAQPPLSIASSAKTPVAQQLAKSTSRNTGKWPRDLKKMGMGIRRF